MVDGRRSLRLGVVLAPTKLSVGEPVRELVPHRSRPAAGLAPELVRRRVQYAVALEHADRVMHHSPACPGAEYRPPRRCCPASRDHWLSRLRSRWSTCQEM